MNGIIHVTFRRSHSLIHIDCQYFRLREKKLDQSNSGCCLKSNGQTMKTIGNLRYVLDALSKSYLKKIMQGQYFLSGTIFFARTVVLGFPVEVALRTM